MYIENLVILVLEAVRVWLYMRCLHTCIGRYKVSKRMIAVYFAAFWGVSSLMEIGVPVGLAVESAPAHYAVDLIFLLGVSFFCYGTAGRRVLTAVLVPAAFWVGKWTIIFSLFQSIVVSKQELLIGTVVAVVAFCLLEFLIERIRKSRQEQERELLEQEIRIYENQFQVIHQSQQLVRSLKHDMKHHIKMLTDMISEGEKDDALEYLSSMGAFMENAKEYVASGNERIDSILNYMISRGKAAGIAVDWKIQIPEQLEISAFDINIVLSNLFENAFNALQDTESPFLHILLRYDRGVFCINMTNNYTDEKVQAPEIWSEHGFGLKNVRRIAEKYHGQLTINKDGNIFEATVLLMI